MLSNKLIKRNTLRPIKSNSGSKKSHYVFSSWIYQNGKRSGAVRAVNRFTADLINTCYYNPSNKSYTIHTLTFDLDFDKADPKWIENDKLNWDKIKEVLEKEEPEILQSITEVVRSSGGKGISLALAVSPIELNRSSSANFQRFALIVQERIVRILNHYSFGADPCAIGLRREMPNYLNPDKLIEKLNSRRNVDEYGVPIVLKLLSYTNKHPVVLDRGPRLWGHLTVELKLAKLYEYLLDENYSSVMSSVDVIKLTGLSKTSFYKIANSKLDWLIIEFISKHEGYRLTLKPTPDLSERTEDLLKGRVSANKNKLKYFADIARPELVEKGTRNAWLTNIILKLKWSGYSELATVKIVGKIVRRIKNYKSSQSCRRFKRIIRSIFNTQKDYRRDIELPEWLKPFLQLRLNKSPRNTKKGLPLCDETCQARAHVDSNKGSIVRNNQLIDFEDDCLKNQIEDRRFKAMLNKLYLVKEKT